MGIHEQAWEETALCVFMWVSAYTHVEAEIWCFPQSGYLFFFEAGSLVEPGVPLSI